MLRGEDDKEVRLITAEGKPIVVPKDSIEERKRGPFGHARRPGHEALEDRASRPDRISGQPQGQVKNGDPESPCTVPGGRAPGEPFSRRLGEPRAARITQSI